MVTQEKKYIIAIITLLGILISGFAVDIYTPSLPAVAKYFNVDKAQSQLTITTYLIGYGLAQLYAGSISDSFGRRFPIFITLVAFIIFSFMIPYATNIYQLQALRLFQGISTAFVNVPCRAIFADLFEDQAFYNMMNYATITWSIGPIVAPVLGGYLQHYFGWYASFYFLAFYALIIFLLNIFILPETIKLKRKFNHKDLLTWYFKLLRDFNYLLGLCCLGFVYSMLILFGVVAPFLIQNVLHYSAIQFGHIALCMGLAWFIGNITNRMLARFSIPIKVKMSLHIMFIVSIIMLIMAIRLPMNIMTITIPSFIIFCFGGMMFPNIFARNIALYQHVAGYANGLLGGVIMLIAGLSSTLGVYLKSTTHIPLSEAYVVLIILSLLCAHLMTFQKPQGLQRTKEEK